MENPPNNCDPETPGYLCIASEEILSALPIIFGIILVLGVYAIIRHEYRKFWGYHNGPGVTPGQGDTLNVALLNFESGKAVTHVQRHTRDPQKHARGFVPSRAYKKDKS